MESDWSLAVSRTGSRLAARFELFLTANSASQLVTTDRLYIVHGPGHHVRSGRLKRGQRPTATPQKTPGPPSAIGISSRVRQMSLCSHGEVNGPERQLSVSWSPSYPSALQFVTARYPAHRRRGWPCRGNGGPVRNGGAARGNSRPVVAAPEGRRVVACLKRQPVQV